MIDGIKEFDFQQLSKDIQLFILHPKDARRVKNFPEYFKGLKFKAK